MSEVAASARVRIFFADFANIDTAGKFNVIGGGITVMGLDAGSGVTAPHSIVALVTFDSQFLGESPAVELALEAEDGSLVTLPGPAGPASPPQILRVGTAEMLKSVSHPAVNVPPRAIRPSVQFIMHFANGLPLPPGRVYRWRVKVDHETRDEWTEAFFVPAAEAGPVVG